MPDPHRGAEFPMQSRAGAIVADVFFKFAGGYLRGSDGDLGREAEFGVEQALEMWTGQELLSISSPVALHVFRKVGILTG